MVEPEIVAFLDLAAAFTCVFQTPLHHPTVTTICTLDVTLTVCADAETAVVKSLEYTRCATYLD